MLDHVTSYHRDKDPNFNINEVYGRCQALFPNGVGPLVSADLGTYFFIVPHINARFIGPDGLEYSAIHDSARPDLNGRPLRLVLVMDNAGSTSNRGRTVAVAGSLPAFLCPNSPSAWLRADEVMEAMRLREEAVYHAFGVHPIKPPCVTEAELCWQTRHRHNTLLSGIGRRVAVRRLGGKDWASCSDSAWRYQDGARVCITNWGDTIRRTGHLHGEPHDPLLHDGLLRCSVTLTQGHAWSQRMLARVFRWDDRALDLEGWHEAFNAHMPDCLPCDPHERNGTWQQDDASVVGAPFPSYAPGDISPYGNARMWDDDGMSERLLGAAIADLALSPEEQFKNRARRYLEALLGRST